MKKSASDVSWEKFGKANPYYAVLTDNRFATENLSEENLQTFFETGEDHVAHVLKTLQFLDDQPIVLDSVLDFGCGTGRLLVPFSRVAENVTGIDVSASMLAEAKNNMAKYQVNNVQLVESNSPDVLKDHQFDLVHSYIVLQHIPVHTGYHVLDVLTQLIKPGGYGMIHLTYSNDKTLIKNQKNKLKSRYQFFSKFFNVVSGRHPDKPYMHMNNYNLAKVFRIIEKAGITRSYVELTNHGGFRGLCLYLAR